MKYGERLKKLREDKNLSQQQLADRLKINRSTYARYELGQTQPDFEILEKLAEFYDVSIDYILGRTDIPNTAVTVAGQEISLTPEEYKLFEEMKKYPIAFHDLQTDPEKKVKQLIKMWEFLKTQIEDMDEDEK